MKLKICSREDIEKMAKMPFESKTALISITDYDAPLVELYNKPEYILRLKFDDVTLEDFIDSEPTEEDIELFNANFHLIDDNQAMQIANFAKNINVKADLLICQCEYGQSRSAAVASAISEYFYSNGIDIFSDERYYPNKSVYKKVLDALKKQMY